MNLRKLITYILRIQFQKWILFSFVALWLHSGMSQGINEINNAYIVGQVTKLTSKGPIHNQEVIIVSDSSYSPNFIYFKKVYTNKEGLFYDTIQTEALKGAINIYTIDCLNKKHDTTLYYRFNWSESNTLQANFSLPVHLATNSPQANFSFNQDPAVNNDLFFKFHDKSNEPNVTSWFWNFGDGAISDTQHPNHTYNESGLYYVTLTIIVQDPITLIPVSSSIKKVVDVKLEKYFFLGGHVKAGYFPIDFGDAYLYKIEDKDYVIIDTAVFNDTLGFYLFPQLIEGNYIVKADLNPNSVLFNEYLQTYYNNKYFWEEADTIFLNASSTEYDIDLIPNDGQYMTGPGILTGKIVYDAGQSGGKSEGPACNIQIILFDEYEEPIEICHSNEDGLFELNQLDLQSYNIHAEVTGKYTIPLNVTLEPSTTEIDEITLIISSSLVHGTYTYGINESGFDQNISDVYPNPVLNRMNLDINLSQSELLDISIIDSYGRNIALFKHNGSQGSNKIQLNLDELSSGLYFIHVSQDSGQGISRKFFKN